MYRDHSDLASPIIVVSLSKLTSVLATTKSAIDGVTGAAKAATTAGKNVSMNDYKLNLALIGLDYK